MSAEIYEISVEKGTTFLLALQLFTDVAGTIPLDLTGCDVVAQIRRGNAADVDFIVTIEDPTSGEIELELDPETTSQIQAGAGEWDFLIRFADGTITKFLKGPAIINTTVSEF